jgi:hypothetical protein
MPCYIFLGTDINLIAQFSPILFPYSSLNLRDEVSLANKKNP